MKSRMMTVSLLLGLALPAYAGHGTIEETDTGYVVEWSGDATDNQPVKRGDGPPPREAQAAAPAGQRAESKAGTPPPPPPPEEEATRPRRTEADEARRNARAERRAARRGTRGGYEGDE